MGVGSEGGLAAETPPANVDASRQAPGAIQALTRFLLCFASRLHANFNLTIKDFHFILFREPREGSSSLQSPVVTVTCRVYGNLGQQMGLAVSFSEL